MHVMHAMVHSRHACGAGLYSDSLSSDRTNYQSHSWEQYAFWAAAWLYSVSKEEGYMVVRAVFLLSHTAFLGLDPED